MPTVKIIACCFTVFCSMLLVACDTDPSTASLNATAAAYEPTLLNALQAMPEVEFVEVINISRLGTSTTVRTDLRLRADTDVSAFGNALVEVVQNTVPIRPLALTGRFYHRGVETLFTGHISAASVGSWSTITRDEIMMTQAAITTTPDAMLIADLPDYELPVGGYHLQIRGAYTHDDAGVGPGPFLIPVYTTRYDSKRIEVFTSPTDGARPFTLLIMLPEDITPGTYRLNLDNDAIQPFSVFVGDPQGETSYSSQVNGTVTLDQVDDVLLNGRFDFTVENLEGEQVEVTAAFHAIPYTPEPHIYITAGGAATMFTDDNHGFVLGRDGRYRFRFSAHRGTLGSGPYTRAEVAFEVPPGFVPVTDTPYDVVGENAAISATVRLDDVLTGVESGNITFYRVAPNLRGAFTVLVPSDAGPITFSGDFKDVPSPDAWR